MLVTLMYFTLQNLREYFLKVIMQMVQTVLAELPPLSLIQLQQWFHVSKFSFSSFFHLLLQIYRYLEFDVCFSPFHDSDINLRHFAKTFAEKFCHCYIVKEGLAELAVSQYVMKSSYSSRETRL